MLLSQMIFGFLIVRALEIEVIRLRRFGAVLLDNIPYVNIMDEFCIQTS